MIEEPKEPGWYWAHGFDGSIMVERIVQSTDFVWEVANGRELDTWESFVEGFDVAAIEPVARPSWETKKATLQPEGGC